MTKSYTVRNYLEKIPSRSGVHRAFWVQTVYIHVGQIPSIDKIIFENFRSRRFLFIVQMASSQFLDGIYSLVCVPKPLRSSQTFVAATAAQNSSTINFPTRFSNLGHQKLKSHFLNFSYTVSIGKMVNGGTLLSKTCLKSLTTHF